MELVCTKACIWQRRRWRVGETCSAEQQPPEKFFQPAETYKPTPKKGEDMDAPMTLAQAQTRIGGDAKSGDVQEARTLGEAADMMFQ